MGEVNPSYTLIAEISRLQAEIAEIKEERDRWKSRAFAAALEVNRLLAERKVREP